MQVEAVAANTAPRALELDEEGSQSSASDSDDDETTRATTKRQNAPKRPSMLQRMDSGGFQQWVEREEVDGGPGEETQERENPSPVRRSSMAGNLRK